MNDRKNSRETVLPVWPFLAGDICMALIAVCIFAFSSRPMGGVAMFFCAAAMGFGAWLLTTPFLKNQSAELRGLDLDSLNPIADQLRRLEELKRLLSDSLAKGPASKDNESALMEIRTALKAMSDEQNQKFQSIQEAFSQEIAGLESRALLAIQSIPKSSAPSDSSFMSPPVTGTDPEEVASMVTSRLRPELAAESEKTLSQMKEHVDESFSQAMSEMADLKLALEQALETIANAAPGTVLAAVAPVAAQPNQAQITEAVSNANSSIETRLRSQVKSVQRLTTEVGSLRRMMRRAMSVKGGASWNMELETSSEPDYSLDMDNEQTDWTSLAPRSEAPSTQAQAQNSLPTPEENSSAITTPDNDDLLEFPSDGFSSPGNFETLEGDVFLTQFSDIAEEVADSESLSEAAPGLDEGQPQEQSQDQVTAEVKFEPGVENADASETDFDSATALSSDPELRDWPEAADTANSETEPAGAQIETSDNFVESLETEQPETAQNSVESSDPASDSEAPASPEPQKEAQEAPEVNEEQSKVSAPDSERIQETQITEATPPQTEPASATDSQEGSSNDNKPQTVRDPKLPSVKAAVRNLFDEAEQDGD